ncbi:MAG: response regulator [Candidatus Nitrohelix vancouverensis]|uniref:Response regulator n=1 Tax=Candidatus Nitrohelix vancouverensis TaxID=2705534 RepID=A0A7T0G476_9BACT|nr:MAG: response regulator [Candidatus Nitrohelix vancouverensis]
MKILYLEDNKDDAGLVIREVKKVIPDSEIILTDNREDFVHHLDSLEIDLVISDYVLPDFSGLEALEIVMQNDVNTPFIFVTGALQTDDQAIETALSGATAFVLKSDVKSIERHLIKLLESRTKKAASLCQSRKSLASSMQLSVDILTKFENVMSKDMSTRDIAKARSKLLVLRESIKKTSANIEILYEDLKGMDNGKR